MRYHVHGVVNSDDCTNGAAVSVSVNANSDDEAQSIAWAVCPSMDIAEVEEAASRDGFCAACLDETGDGVTNFVDGECSRCGEEITGATS